MEKSKNKIKSYVIVILSILFVAILGSVFVRLGGEWFALLVTPDQFPPNIIIPIIWSVIYILFGIILCVWISKNSIPNTTIAILVINGILNILWCLLFFTLQQTFGGLIIILLLLIMSIYLVLNIAKLNGVYAIVLSLYPIWVSIATTLNVALWIMN